ncbi:hypothetical protein KW801_00100 [Candidatus Saccharibacteria bacterium]|nr:hypothetical protein [Candidatus Saccharibacteria bacterium]
MAHRKFPKPVYEMLVDERFSNMVTFGANEHQSREEEVIDFIRERFTGIPDYSLRLVRPKEYGKKRLTGIRALADTALDEVVQRVDISGKLELLKSIDRTTG